MGKLHEIRSQLLSDGRITPAEVDIIRAHVDRDGALDLEDVRLLVSVLSEAREVCDEFDDLFFPVLKHVILEDGRVGVDEQYYLLKMLYADGHLRPRERQFLAQLQRELKEVSPEFAAMCDTASGARDVGWELGGIPTPPRR